MQNYSENNIETNIGVLLPPGTGLARRYYDKLKERLANVEIKVQIFLAEINRGDLVEIPDDFDFEQTGIKVITYQSAKGLEFDTVFLPAIDHDYFNLEVPDFLDRPEVILRNEMYVCCSRARERPYFLYIHENNHSFVLSTLRENVHLFNVF